MWIGGWLGRKALLYILIVLAIIASAFVVPLIKTEWDGPRIHIQRARQLEGVRFEVRKAHQAAIKELAAAASAAKTRNVAELDRAIAIANRDRAVAISERRGAVAQAASLAMIDGDAILADQKRNVLIQLRDREIVALTATRARLIKRNALSSLTAELNSAVAASMRLRDRASRARRNCTIAAVALAAFEARWLVWITRYQYRRVEHARLQQRKNTHCADAKTFANQTRATEATAYTLKNRYTAALLVYRQSRRWADDTILLSTGNIDRQIKAEQTTAEGSWRARARLWATRIHLDEVLKAAALALLFIFISPFIVRLFCYFVLAPAAMRRPAIHLLVPDDGRTAVPLPERSGISVNVRLLPGEELLVRQGHHQASSDAGTKRTRWFMDWHHPITSIATGMIFLTCIRGDDQGTVISAARNPFAEVTVVVLPPNAPCVLQPRALVAIVQPIHQPLRVTSHWRLFSLNAWLTMQLRYLIFHGPAQLVVKGGRGVHVEHAERGRVFGQDQLIGFSANLAYSVTRAETFWPYFLGREQLMKDRIEAGEGVIIVEEAPLADRATNKKKKGIEGMIDAGIKMFGL